jgi:hypothetical protein
MTQPTTTQPVTHELRAPLGGRFKTPEDVAAHFKQLGATINVINVEGGFVHFMLDDDSASLAGASNEDLSEALMRGDASATQVVKAAQGKKR